MSQQLIVQDFLPLSKRDILRFEGCTEACSQALEEAGAIRRSDGIIHCHIGRLYGIAEPDDE